MHSKNQRKKISGGKAQKQLGSSITMSQSYAEVTQSCTKKKNYLVPLCEFFVVFVELLFHRITQSLHRVTQRKKTLSATLCILCGLCGIAFPQSQAEVTQSYTTKKNTQCHYLNSLWSLWNSFSTELRRVYIEFHKEKNTQCHSVHSLWSLWNCFSTEFHRVTQRLHKAKIVTS